MVVQQPAGEVRACREMHCKLEANAWPVRSIASNTTDSMMADTEVILNAYLACLRRCWYLLPSAVVVVVVVVARRSCSSTGTRMVVVVEGGRKGCVHGTPGRVRPLASEI